MTSEPEYEYVEWEPEVEPMKPTIFVEDMMDVFLPEDDAYIWLKLVRGYDGDLELQRCDEDWMGEDWLSHQDDDVSSILSSGWTIVKIGGIEFQREWTYWALEMAVAPGQPFLVRIQQPKWTQSGWESPEWDCDWYWDLIRVMPRTDRQTLQAWEGFFKFQMAFEQQQIELTRRFEVLRIQDLRAMYVEKSHYSWGSYDPDYGHEGQGLEVRLRTKRSRLGDMIRPYHTSLASGQSKQNNYELAARDMIKNALEKYPHLREDFLIRLAGLSVTKWMQEDPLYATA
jgi:hypothetical protein